MADLSTDTPSTGDIVDTDTRGPVTDASSSFDLNHTYTIWQIIYIVIGLLGLLGNAFVVIVIINNKAMRRMVTNTFIINQSIVDGLAGACLILVNVIVKEEGQNFSAWYKVTCRVWYSRGVLWAFFCCSSYNLMAITLERLVAVCKPIWHKTSFTRSKQAVVLLVVWLVSPIPNLMQGIIDSHIMDGICYAFGSGHHLSGTLGLLTIANQFIMPAVVIVVSYTIIAILLHLRSKRLHQHNATALQHSKSVQGGRHVIKIMALVSLCFLLCWTTNEVIYFMYLIGRPLHVDSTLYNLSVVAVFCNCCCNPFVYIIKYKEFQKGVRACFHCQPAAVAPSTVQVPSATS